ncbi:MAG: hypothetical protein WCD89_25510 [Anaerocolumna sp.]
MTNILYLFNDMTSLYHENDSPLKFLGSFDEGTPQEHFLITTFRKLNEKDQNKVIDYAEDVSITKEYTEKK